MAIKDRQAGFVEGVLKVLSEGMISTEDFWEIVEGADFTQKEVLQMEISGELVSDILNEECA